MMPRAMDLLKLFSRKDMLQVVMEISVHQVILRKAIHKTILIIAPNVTPTEQKTINSHAVIVDNSLKITNENYLFQTIKFIK